jgi:thiol-disulfide isomerase/thioredoxin
MTGELHTNHFFISQKKKFILFCTEDMLSADSPLLQQWQEVSQSYQDHAIFSYLSNLEFGTLGDYFKIRGINELPIIVSLASNLKFKSNTINLFNSKSHMNEFVSQVLNGTARQLLLSSEVIPITQRGTVFQVVADNMFDIVGDPERDVLLVLYTAWCKVCQHFIPVLELVGRAVKAENRIRIAKINIEANDIPSEWKVVDSSIPTLLYFPVADKPYSNHQVPIPRLFWNVEPGLYEIIAFLQRESSFEPTSLNIATNTQLSLIMNDEEELILQYLEEEHFFRRNEKRVSYEDALVDWVIGEVVFDGKRWHIAGGLFFGITWVAMLLYILKIKTYITKEKDN